MSRFLFLSSLILSVVNLAHLNSAQAALFVGQPNQPVIDKRSGNILQEFATGFDRSYPVHQVKSIAFAKRIPGGIDLFSDESESQRVLTIVTTPEGAAKLHSNLRKALLSDKTFKLLHSQDLAFNGPPIAINNWVQLIGPGGQTATLDLEDPTRKVVWGWDELSWTEKLYFLLKSED